MRGLGVRDVGSLGWRAYVADGRSLHCVQALLGPPVTVVPAAVPFTLPPAQQVLVRCPAGAPPPPGGVLVDKVFSSAGLGSVILLTICCWPLACVPCCIDSCYDRIYEADTRALVGYLPSDTAPLVQSPGGRRYIIAPPPVVIRADMR